MQMPESFKKFGGYLKKAGGVIKNHPKKILGGISTAMVLIASYVAATRGSDKGTVYEPNENEFGDTFVPVADAYSTTQAQGLPIIGFNALGNSSSESDCGCEPNYPTALTKETDETKHDDSLKLESNVYSDSNGTGIWIKGYRIGDKPRDLEVDGSIDSGDIYNILAFTQACDIDDIYKGDGNYEYAPFIIDGAKIKEAFKTPYGLLIELNYDTKTTYPNSNSAKIGKWNFEYEGGLMIEPVEDLNGTFELPTLYKGFDVNEILTSFETFFGDEKNAEHFGENGDLDIKKVIIPAFACVCTGFPALKILTTEKTNVYPFEWCGCEGKFGTKNYLFFTDKYLCDETKKIIEELLDELNPCPKKTPTKTPPPTTTPCPTPPPFHPG